MKYLKPFLIVLAVLVVDQVLKYWVKTNMYIGEEFPVLGNWFYIHFTENNGMAFGLELAGKYGKLILTTFRIVAVIGIVWYLLKLIKEEVPNGLVVSVALILAGALGNILDSVFYGPLFGYAPFFYGKVVDMLYFPLVNTTWPSWVPWLGGDTLQFFRPVFNIADTAISTGVITILVFQRRFYKKKSTESEERTKIEEAEETPEASALSGTTEP